MSLNVCACVVVFVERIFSVAEHLLSNTNLPVQRLPFYSAFITFLTSDQLTGGSRAMCLDLALRCRPELRCGAPAKVY